MTNLPRSRQSDIVVQELKNETLIYDLKINKAYCLNESSTQVWQMCDGKHSINQISRSLSRKLNSLVTEDLVWLAIDQFKRDGLLENNDEFEINFNGLNRRQVIKKAGLASLVILPLVSSIVAPMAAMAASGGAALFGACPTAGGSGCASGLSCNRCFGTSCPFTNHCCATGGLTGKGPVLGNSCQASIDLCNITALQSCCSGRATFDGIQCGNFSTSGTCSCI